MKNIFLTAARKDWLAKFFQHATLVLLAGVLGGGIFLKLALKWRLAVLAGVVISFWSGLAFATNPLKEEK